MDITISNQYSNLPPLTKFFKSFALSLLRVERECRRVVAGVFQLKYFEVVFNLGVSSIEEFRNFGLSPYQKFKL